MEQLGIGSKVNHPKFGLGVVVNLDSSFYKIYFSSPDELKSIGREFDGMEVVDKVVPDALPLDLGDIKKVVEGVFEEYMDKTGVVALGNKWIGGTVTINAGSAEMQAKEIPIRTFFNKVIMVRDRLRVLEQNINSHDSLSEEEKVHLQQYITRAYGSLTTFNVLFADKSQQFKGSGGS